MAIKKPIPITRPYIGSKEGRNACKVIKSGWLTQGPVVRKFEEDFADYVRAKHACAVSSCTTALHLALLAVGVRPGNFVITVSHSFIATANAVRYCMAEPAFVDIDPGTYNISPEKLEHFLKNECVKAGGGLVYKKAKFCARGESPLSVLDKHSGEFGRVAAILAVHQMGMPCDIERIVKIGRAYSLPVVEDAACALGSEYLPGRGKGYEKIGKPHGEIACFSFHPRKVLTTGDGGMITTNNSAYDEKFRLLRQHGMNISDVVRHASKKIIAESYVTTGFNYRMTDIQAAVGIEQLKNINTMLKARRDLVSAYKRYLGGVSWIGLPKEPDYARTNWQSYAIRILKDAPVSRDALMNYLLSKGIATRFGIMNAHAEEPYKNSEFILPESESARSEAMLLPLYPELTKDQVKRISSLISQCEGAIDD